MADVGAGTQKVWTFQTAAGPFAGLAATYEERGTSSTLLHKDYTWAQNAAGNVYVISVATTQDPGTAYAAQTKTTQSLDTYGNILVSYLYDYGNPNSPARTYSYSYITDPNYISRYSGTGSPRRRSPRQAGPSRWPATATTRARSPTAPA